MKILVACEYSQTVTKAFRDKGHEAYSADILPTDGNPDWHFTGDVRSFLDADWDMLIAHPPCTYLTNSGVCWLHKDPSRWDKLYDACSFFNWLQNAKIPKICIENPIPHKYAREKIGKYSQIIHPYQFGHTERKATCLWLDGLPKLRETHNVYEEMIQLPKSQQQRLHWLPPSKDRWKERSKTYQGIADAMANQWG
jgi:hypothetical protein